MTHHRGKGLDHAASAGGSSWIAFTQEKEAAQVLTLNNRIPGCWNPGKLVYSGPLTMDFWCPVFCCPREWVADPSGWRNSGQPGSGFRRHANIL